MEGKKSKSHELVHVVKPENMTRDELDNALTELRASQFHEHEFACCYSIVPPKWVECETKCDKCGGPSALIMSTYEENYVSIEIPYNELAEEFKRLGYKAKMSYYCEKCVAEDPEHLAPIVFSFQAEGMDHPFLSYPNSRRFTPEKYNLALSFLKGIHSNSLMHSVNRDADWIQNYSDYYADDIAEIIGGNNVVNKPEKDTRAERRKWIERRQKREKDNDLPF